MRTQTIHVPAGYSIRITFEPPKPTKGRKAKPEARLTPKHKPGRLAKPKTTPQWPAWYPFDPADPPPRLAVRQPYNADAMPLTTQWRERWLFRNVLDESRRRADAAERLGMSLATLQGWRRRYRDLIQLPRRADVEPPFEPNERERRLIATALRASEGDINKAATLTHMPGDEYRRRMGAYRIHTGLRPRR